MGTVDLVINDSGTLTIIAVLVVSIAGIFLSHLDNATDKRLAMIEATSRSIQFVVGMFITPFAILVGVMSTDSPQSYTKMEDFLVLGAALVIMYSPAYLIYHVVKFLLLKIF
jgi:hypothetical protein